MRLAEDYKYKSIRATAGVLAELMAEAVAGLERAGKLESRVVVVPLPTIGRHVRERGFDHTWLLAKRLAKLKGWEAERILERRNKTVQVGANKAKRKEQANKAYGVAPGWLKRGLDTDTTYLLVDDIWTTGASMEAAISTIKEAGAKKVVAAVILVPRDV
ncbi:ComF family protein, partial [Candidatus Saccharibacteria bacterium]|nr:ComF family protein [Candidatus Saccharibacteria bacterium]